MKNFNSKTIAILVGLMLSACSPYLEWPNFPERRFKGYAPYKRQSDRIKFYSDKNDTINLFVVDTYYRLIQDQSFGSGSYGWEIASLGAWLHQDSIILSYGFSAENRTLFSASWQLKIRDKDHAFGNYENKNTGDKEDFLDLLTDTITMTNNYGEYCIIVNGKGLIEYSVDGTVWKLIERE
jgi:hypothetical protein